MATTLLQDRKQGIGYAPLPRWPLTAIFACYPIWWVLGVGEMAWIPIACLMVVLMAKRGGIRVPRGFGVWLLFLVLMSISIVGIDSSGRLIGFMYRAFLYGTVTIIFVYVYNARHQVTMRYVLGIVSLFWVWAVVGGFASVFFPLFSFRTPLGYVLPASLQANELVGEMVVRRLTQYNPDGWFDLEPRPSAPFLYTNQWGNVYSLTFPMVIAYLLHLKRGRRFWLLIATMVLSLIPAMLTLNRGMFIGLAVAAIYITLRWILAGQLGRAMWIICSGAVVALIAIPLSVGERLTSRVETSTSTENRADLYRETFERTLDSPLFGYGAPRPSFTEGMPSAGTQGHVWTIMFSHGFPALVCFMLALLWLWAATSRTRTVTHVLLHTVQLVIVVEVLYYGVLPHGLIVSFTAAALTLRELKPPEPARIT